jgi:hypothetical protein
LSEIIHVLKTGCRWQDCSPEYGIASIAGAGAGAWTSTTRSITNPYNIVFHLRLDDGKLAPADVKTVWHGILRSTVKGDDLKKVGPDD